MAKFIIIVLMHRPIHYYGCYVLYDMHTIGGDTHTAGAAIVVPLRILGQQPIQNAAPTPTIVIVIDPFCCNQKGPTYITFTLPLRHERINRSSLRFKCLYYNLLPFYARSCMAFPEKLLKSIATRYAIFSLQFTKNRLVAGLHPDPLVGLKLPRIN